MRNTMTIAVLFFSVVSISGLCFSQSDRCLPPVPHGGGEYEDICDKVVKIDCGGGLLSGFFTTVSGKRGIATALHGVLGCTNLVAFNQVRSFSGLRLEMVNIERDAAFLTSDALQSASIPSLSIQSLDEFDFANEEMFVVGYPQGVAAQISFSLTPHANAIMTLSDILPFNERETLRRRGSPGLAQQVLFLSGSIQHGLSGAPVLSGSGRVIAFADGGLGEGALNINWAIPCRDIPWENASDRRNEIAQLSGESSAEDLFGVRPGAAFKVPPLYLTDARDSKGKIYLFNNGDLSVKYARPRGNIYSLAVSPRGELHFSNHNDRNLYLLAKNGSEELIYTHSTYLRDVAFDRKGNLYFSESSGAGRDGKIFRLAGNRAVLVFTVRLKEVDGFWAGNFAFDNDGRLWLSSGNRVPANLYMVQNNVPRQVFASAGSIAGFCFLDDGSLVFTDWRKTLQRITVPGFVITELGTLAQFQWLSDAAPAALPGVKMLKMEKWKKPMTIKPYRMLEIQPQQKK